jgi:large subunit ribosomal protein L28
MAGMKGMVYRTLSDLRLIEAYDSIPRHKKTMAKVCAITQKRSIVGGRYSNRTRATQFNPSGNIRRYPNLQKKRIYVPELKKSFVLNVSTRALRTIEKNGAFRTLKEAGIIK